MWAAETRDRGWEKSTVSYLDDRTKGGLYFNHYLVKMQVHSTYSHFAEMEITIHLRCLLFGTFFQILGPIYFSQYPQTSGRVGGRLVVLPPFHRRNEKSGSLLGTDRVAALFGNPILE